ncbi:MAG: hypothetical protein ACQKBY_01490 [Verrucomicrobiales bacterium]
MRHRLILLAMRAELALAGREEVTEAALLRRVLEALEPLSPDEEHALAKEPLTEMVGRIGEARRQLADLVAEGSFLEARDGMFRLTATGRELTEDLLG